MQYLHSLRKSDTNVYAICVILTNTYTLCVKVAQIFRNVCKFNQYLCALRKMSNMKKNDHSLLILRKNFENSDRSMYAICVGWVNFVHSLRCLLKNLRSQQNFYATTGRTGRDKYHL